MIYSADFETTTDPSDCRVWAWAVCEIEDERNIWFGDDVQSFVEFMKKNQGEYYFHNAGFDSEFIFSYLLKEQGFTWCERAREKGITLLMSSARKFYQSTIYFTKSKRGTTKATIKDSYKKLPYSVDKIAKDYGISYQKLEIDYKLHRPGGYKMTEQEREYIAHDVQIIAVALRMQFDQELTALTIGADALKHAKSSFEFQKYFPVLPLEVDAEIRKAYKGGYTFVNPLYRGKDIGAGIVLDVNSMYPAQMKKPLPVGYPTYYEGKYTGERMHIQRFTCTCELKPEKLPTLQVKKNPYFAEHEYVTQIIEPTEICMTDIDMKLFFEHYYVDVVEWSDAYAFNQAQGMFDPYIDYWMAVKENSTGAVRMNAKLMLNSLYGKLATNPDVTGRYMQLDDDGVIQYPMKPDKEYRDPVYTAAGAYITAYSRDLIIRSAQTVYDRFVYCDTDSLHLLGTDIPAGLDIHPTRLGAWDHEATFERAKFPRSKTYIEVINGVNHVKCAGLRADMRDAIPFEKFEIGLQIPGGKLRPRHVPGGIVLEEATFTLRG